MNTIHAFMLLITILGQPENAVAVCDTYKKCSDEGAKWEMLYEAQLGTPKNFSYRIIPILIMPETPAT